MASFSQRKNEWWQAKIRRKGHPVQSKTFPRKVDAEVWVRKIEGEMDRGVFVSRAEAESTTLLEALERYEREITPRKKGAEQERYRIRFLMKHALATRYLASVRGLEMARFRDELLDAKLAPSTVMKYLAVLSHLYEIASKEWAIEVDNPVKKITKPKVDNARVRRLSKEEETFLLAALDDPGDSVRTLKVDRRNIWMPKIVRFALESAMRQGEILSLDGKNIVLKRGDDTLLRSVAHLLTTKNGSSRKVPLSSVATSLLCNSGDNVERLRSGKVFPTTASALKQSFTRAVARGRRAYDKSCVESGIQPDPSFLEDFHFHDLRHEAISRLVEKGLGMMEVAAITGHKDFRMLKRYYHPREDELAVKLG